MENLFEDLVFVGALCSVIALVVMILLAVFLGVHNRHVEEIFAKIYKESEERIGRANTMVSQCTDSMKVQSQTCQGMAAMYNEITKEYIEQIRLLQQQRDKITEENKDLARTNAELSAILSHKKDQTINIQSPK